MVSDRDSKGRFLPGNSGNGGRPKGARNRVTSQFLNIIAADFEQHGAEALAKLRDKDPAAYLQLVASLIPRQLITQHETEPDYSEMDWAEIIALIEKEQMNEQVRIALDEIKQRGFVHRDKLGIK